MGRSRYLAVILVFTSFVPSCGGKVGAETRGQSVGTEYGNNATLIAPAKRHQRPSFKGTTLDGATISDVEFRGSVVVVNFWASWCGPCRKEEPNLVALWKRYGSRGVRFLGVDTRDTRADGKAFRDEFDVTYPSLFDPDALVSFRFRVFFLPATYVLDRQGRVAASIRGASTDPGQLAKILDAELAG